MMWCFVRGVELNHRPDGRSTGTRKHAPVLGIPAAHPFSDAPRHGSATVRPMAPRETFRSAARLVATAVYVVLGHALLATWWRPVPWMSQGLEAALATAAAWGLTRAVDGRWLGPALLGLLVEGMRFGVLRGLGERPDVGAWSGVVVLVPVLAAWGASRRPT